jgi:predicted HicB family RNase H-like nuclease
VGLYYASIHRQIAMLARQAGVTINAYIKDTLEKKIRAAAVL